MSRRAVLVATLAAAALGATGCRRGNADSGQQPVDVTLPGAEGGGPSTDAGLEAGLVQGQVDRAGHPLVTILLVPGSLQDEYNEQPSFEANVPRTLQDALESRLVALDTLAIDDGGPDPVDWPVPDGGAHPLLPVFVTDVLLVDTSRSCVSGDGGFSASYLDLEREIYMDGGPHATCGGRTPAEAVVDETLTLLVTNGRVPVTQGVAGPTRPATTAFPYLADPN
jgi:hypothetical protein